MTLQNPRTPTKIRTHTATINLRDAVETLILQVDVTRYRRVFVTAYHNHTAAGAAVDVEVLLRPLGARTTYEWDGARWVLASEVLVGGGFLNVLNTRFSWLNNLISGQTGFQLRIEARALTVPDAGSITVNIEGELA